ncbi:MAG TPA: serine hydrolase domain-containing protein [Chloroflexota bacterium]|nr:serine hydrolase domain-containing protein [Chloroflexota bacterium]
MKLRYGEPEEAGMSARRVRHVAQLAQSWVEQGITPSLVVLAARRGIIVLHEAYGRVGLEPDAPVLRRDTIFPLSSLSKPITATAAMILVEDGLLGLNRPVREYLPEFGGEGKDTVMVHHLLTHTSGLRDEDLDAYAETKKGSIAIPPAEATQHPLVHEELFLRYDAPLWKAPGAEMSYCSFGYELLGEIVRRISGQNLADFARERIFEPLGMADTSYTVPDAKRRRVVRRAPDSPDAELDSPSFQQTPWASGTAFSTALDMAIFGQMFLNRGVYGDVRVLSPAAVAEMTRDQIRGISAHFFDEYFPDASWGLGWGVRGGKNSPFGGSLYSPSTFEHGGGGVVYLWCDPAHDLVGAYFSVASGLVPGSTFRPIWCVDLFTDAVTATVDR